MNKLQRVSVGVIRLWSIKSLMTIPAVLCTIPCPPCYLLPCIPFTLPLPAPVPDQLQPERKVLAVSPPLARCRSTLEFKTLGCRYYWSCNYSKISRNVHTFKTAPLFLQFCSATEVRLPNLCAQWYQQVVNEVLEQFPLARTTLVTSQQL